MKKNIYLWVFLTPLLVWLGVLIFLPHLALVEVSLSDRRGGSTLNNYLVFFEQPLYWNTFLRTAWMSGLATLLTLIISFPVAYYVAKVATGKSKLALLLLCILPFWLSELVRAYGWIIILRESGLLSNLLLSVGLTSSRIEFLYNDVTILMGLVYNGMLFMVVPLVSALESLDDSQVEAGFDLGGDRLDVLREIVIPHAVPGMVSGCIIVFMLSLGNYLVPNLLGGKDSLWFTEQIFTQFILRFNWEQGGALGILLLVLSSAMVWLVLKLSGTSLQSTVGR
ncbi:ABC transporter permease [Vibrio sp. WXL103]|uniref:ABC transporter permease n=1 Tax=unclassified Vibrio TaxID=2614977 RepID=UPI003EC7AC02